MANIKRKANSRPFAGKVIPKNIEKPQKQVAPVKLVYFDPEDLRQLQKLDVELTAELRKKRGSKDRLLTIYEFLTK